MHLEDPDPTRRFRHRRPGLLCAAREADHRHDKQMKLSEWLKALLASEGGRGARRSTGEKESRAPRILITSGRTFAEVGGDLP